MNQETVVLTTRRPYSSRYAEARQFIIRLDQIAISAFTLSQIVAECTVDRIGRISNKLSSQ